MMIYIISTYSYGDLSTLSVMDISEEVFQALKLHQIGLRRCPGKTSIKNRPRVRERERGGCKVA